MGSLGTAMYGRMPCEFGSGIGVENEDVDALDFRIESNEDGRSLVSSRRGRKGRLQA